MRLTGIVALLLLLVTATAGTAHAQGMNAQCSVTELLATNEKKGIDARLDKYKAQLGQPPFKSWDSFTLLGEHNVTLERAKPQTVKLDNGAMTLLFKDKLVEEAGKARVRVNVDLDDASGKRLISTLVVFGGAANYGGQPYKGGTHFVFLICSAK